MRSLYTIEINDIGLVISVSAPPSFLLEGLLPKVGNNITLFWDEYTNNEMKEYLQNLFSSLFSIEFSFIADGHTIHCTGFKQSDEKAFLFLKTIGQEATKKESTLDSMPLQIQGTEPPLTELSLQCFTANLPLVVFEVNLYPDGSFEFGFMGKEISNFFPDFNKDAVNAVNNLLYLRVHPEDNQKFKDSISDTYKTNVWDIEYRFIEKGEIRWAKGFGRAEERGEYKTIYAYIQDITEKKRLEQKLKLHEQSFRTAVLPMFFATRDAVIYDYNDALSGSLGYSREEFGKLTIFDISTRHTPESWKKRWDNIKAGETQTVTTRIRKKDNTLIFAEITTSIFEYEGMEFSFTSFIDITEQTKFQEALRLSEEKYKYLFENSPHPMIMWDFGTLDILDVNRKSTEVYGYSKEEFTQLNIRQIRPIEDIPLIEAATKNIESYGVRHHGVWRHLKKNGEVMYMEVSAQVFDFNGKQVSFNHNQDVTQRLKAENQLKLVDHSFRTASLPMLFLTMEGNVFDYNEAFCSLLGYDREEFSKVSMFDFTTIYTPELWEKRWQDLKVEQSHPFTTRLRKKDNLFVDVEVKSNMFNYEGMELVFSSFIDITDKLKQDKELKLVEYAFRKASSPQHFLNKDGSVYAFNEAACKLLGYTEEEYRNIVLFDFSVNHTPETWKLKWEEMRKGNILPYTTKLRRKDNSLVDVEIRSDLLIYDNLELCFTTFPDITEKKKTEERLILTDFLFRNAVVPVLIAREDSTFYDFNEATLNLHGYSAEEMAKMRVSNLVVLGDRASAYKEAWGYLKEHKTFTTIVQHRKKDGTLIDVEIRANYIKYGDLELNCSYLIDITEKKKIEKRLKLVDFSFRQANQAMSFFKLNGEVFDFNDAACNLFGYTREEYAGLHIYNDINPNFDLTKWKKRVEDVREGKNNLITQLQKKDGSLIDVEVDSFIVNLEDGEIIFAFYTDITERLEHELLLRRSIERFQNATLATDDVIWEADLIEHTAYYTNNFTTVFGYPSANYEDADDNEWSRNVHPDDLKRVLEETRVILKTGGERWRKEYRFRKANGDDAIVLDKGFVVKDETGKAIKLVGALRDITNRKEEEERLLLLEKVVTETAQSIVIADATEGMDTPVIYTNEAFTQITGYTLEDVKGQNPRILHRDMNTKDDEERTKMRNAIKDFIPWKVEVINTKKNGEHYWAEISGFPVFDKKKGKYSHWVAIQSDVTQRKIADKEREQLMNELIQNNQELKQFSFITSHNLRAPLTNLISICRLIKTETITDPKTLKFIDAFKTSTFELNQTLNDIIKILIIKESVNLKKEDVSLKEIFDKVKMAFSMQLSEERVIIEADFNEVPTVMFTSVYLESIFMNLLSNSIKFRDPERNPVVIIKTTKNIDGSTRLVFSDNGIGINMYFAKEKIFGLYHRFHSNTHGKGIGLYLVHSQITALGGKIGVESEEGVGTTFTITFK